MRFPVFSGSLVVVLQQWAWMQSKRRLWVNDSLSLIRKSVQIEQKNINTVLIRSSCTATMVGLRGTNQWNNIILTNCPHQHRQRNSRRTRPISERDHHSTRTRAHASLCSTSAWARGSLLFILIRLGRKNGLEFPVYHFTKLLNFRSTCPGALQH